MQLAPRPTRTSGPLDSEGHPTGRNGARRSSRPTASSVENLSACNFLTGSQRRRQRDLVQRRRRQRQTRNWAPGGAPTCRPPRPTTKARASRSRSYGIFTSNTFGPGLYTQVYANNRPTRPSTSAPVRTATRSSTTPTPQNSDLGYSGTNSGGHLIIQNSEFDNNQSGFVTNSQNNDDAPSPQDGVCPGGGTGPTGTHSCWLFTKNSVHDNNNPNVPDDGRRGSRSGRQRRRDRRRSQRHGQRQHRLQQRRLGNPAGALPRHRDAAADRPLRRRRRDGNRRHSTSATTTTSATRSSNNTLTNNGFFGNPSNVDLAEISNLEQPGNCWHGNVDTGGHGHERTETDPEPAAQRMRHPRRRRTAGQPARGAGRLRHAVLRGMPCRGPSRTIRGGPKSNCSRSRPQTDDARPVRGRAAQRLVSDQQTGAPDAAVSRAGVAGGIGGLGFSALAASAAGSFSIH